MPCRSTALPSGSVPPSIVNAILARATSSRMSQYRGVKRSFPPRPRNHPSRGLDCGVPLEGFGSGARHDHCVVLVGGHQGGEVTCVEGVAPLLIEGMRQRPVGRRGFLGLGVIVCVHGASFGLPGGMDHPIFLGFDAVVSRARTAGAFPVGC